MASANRAVLAHVEMRTMASMKKMKTDPMVKKMVLPAVE